MKRILVISMVMCACLSTMAQTERFCIASEGKTASIIVDADDWKGVIRAAHVWLALPTFSKCDAK